MPATMISDLELAHAHHRAGRRSEAEALCRAALARDPKDPHALHLLALMALAQGRPRPAARLARMAIDAAPDVPDFHNTLGAALGDLWRWPAAVACFRRAVALRPDYPQGHHNLGLALARADRPAQAAEAFARAAGLDPANVEARKLQGDDLRKAWRFADAADAYRQVLEREPGRAEVIGDLAGALGEVGDATASADCQRRLIEAWPRAAWAHSNLLFTLLHVDGLAPEQLVAEHVEWARRHAPPGPGRSPVEFPNERNADRRLRVGYLSPDFRRHPLIAFFEPVLEAHDRDTVDVFCYCDAEPDATTERLRGLGHAWRQVRGLSDDEVEAMVSADAIDILVELAGHTGGNRLPLMARRIAPVQATYLGYPATTGIAAIDYRISSDDLDAPAGEDPARHATERPARIPGGCFCYRPFGTDEAAPEVNELPALSRAGGQVTFAALNRPLKATPTSVDLWARVLEAVPGSRLLVLSHGGSEASGEGVRRRLVSLGIPSERLTVAPRRSRADYFRLFHEADVCLDSFPYCGQTTTCDAAWMGVPTVTLAGDTHPSRVGRSLMNMLGLPHMACDTADEYVAAAASLAADFPRLADLRQGLRSRMAASPLCDGPGLARKLEAVYRAMWRAWCGAGSGAR